MSNEMYMNLNLRKKLISFPGPQVMGILNVTPDSFFDGGKYTGIDAAISQTEYMLEQGAAFIDIGGQSTRPGATDIGLKEEMNRVIPVIEALVRRFPDIYISIDTYRAQAAKKAIEAGACMVNDISAGDDDPQMFETIAQLQVPYIFMHKQGRPQTMQKDPQYENVFLEVFDYLQAKSNQLRQLGINDMIIDPGFGFGKTVEHNFELLRQLEGFKHLGFPILAGVSRKSMINKVIHTKPEDALNGTTVLNTIALLNGASILRVHDVKEAVEAVKLVGRMSH